MTRLFAIDLQLWCVVVFSVAILAETVLDTLLKLELIRGDRAISGYETGRGYSTPQLLRMHKSLFKRSWKRSLVYIFAGALLLAAVPYTVLFVNESFMDNKLLHLIPKGR